MMLGFSNHLLVRPKADGSWDDRDLKDALRAGRLYGAFDSFGTPAGFDFTATAGGATKEMGEEVSLASAPVLNAVMPSLRELDASGDQPVLSLKVLRARAGGWDEVAAGAASLSFTPTQPGAYRAEVRIVPTHLKKWMSAKAAWIKAERPWVYSNAIYVVP